MSEQENLVSIKELAAKLKSSDALLKKMVKDFGIETTSVNKRLHLDDQGVTTIREIIALKASGKKNNEIKEMFDAAQAEKKSEAKEEKAEKPKRKPRTKKKEKAEEDSSEETEAKEDSEEEEKEVKATKTKRKPRTKKKEKAEEDSSEEAEAQESNEEEEATEEEAPKAAKTKKTREKKERKPKSKKKEEVKTNVDAKDIIDEESKEIDITHYLDEDGEVNLDELIEDHDIDVDIDDLDDDIEEDFEDDEDIEESKVVESKDGRGTQKKIKRRQFSYRYIQRQIANDSKRVNYIKQKLRRGRLSTKEQMVLEDSLTHRYKLLSGWVHMLRWVKS